jgi:hypothetical protein
LAARWHPTGEMTSPFDSTTPMLYRRSVEIFRLSLAVQKLFEYIDLDGNLASQFLNVGWVMESFDPEM